MKTIRFKLYVLFIIAIFIIFYDGQANATWEVNVDRPGMDYRNFDLVSPDATLCQRECVNERRCVAWTYVKPGIQGPKARCWLKSGAPAQIRNTNTISGVMRSASHDRAVHFMYETLTMTPPEARDGQSVAFTFRVENTTAHTFTRVQIRVTIGGRVLRDVLNQVIDPGINTYTVTVVFRRPTATAGSLLIQLLDRTGTYSPAPVICFDDRRIILTPNNTYRLADYEPLL